MPFDAKVLVEQHTSVLNTKANCAMCPASRHCLIDGACNEDIGQWASLVQNFVSLPHPGKTLIEAGTDANAIYIVRAGCLKSCTVDADGQERVRSFHFPGDVIGLDALGASTYQCNVVAVSAAQVCRLSRKQVMDLLAKRPQMMQRLLDRTSRELAQALTLAGDYTAEQRVAAFVLSIQARLGNPSGTVRLPMTRRDIANYLRLATETVCRVLTRFEGKGWIESQDKKLTVRKADALKLTSSSMALGA